MKRFGSFVLVASITALPRPAGAALLSCDQFRTRFEDALHAMPGAAPGPLTFTALPRQGVAGLTMIAWGGVPGLSGRLTCGDGNAFADFYMVADPAVRAAAAALVPGFAAVGAASICALSAGSQQDCVALAATITGEGLEQYADDLAQHDDQPQGLQDYDVAEGLDAVFYVTPTALSWAIGPGLYAPVDDARAPLVPKEREKED